MDILKNQRGGIASFLFVIMLVLIFTTTTLLLGIVFGARKNATTVYTYFAEAMEFAAQAANYDGKIEQVVLRQNEARQYFEVTFARITNTDHSNNLFIPHQSTGSLKTIKLTSFTSIQAGQPIPGGTAQQPGYQATIKILIKIGGVPFVGDLDIEIPMRYFAVVKSKQIG